MSGKLECTGRGSHRPRTLGHFELIDDEPGVCFSLEVRPDPEAERGVYFMPWVWVGGPPIHLRCVTCPRDMRFKVSDLDRFLREDASRRNRDVSFFR